MKYNKIEKIILSVAVLIFLSSLTVYIININKTQVLEETTDNDNVYEKEIIYPSNKTYSEVKTDFSGPYSYSSINEKNYDGIILKILTHEKPVMGEPTQLHAQQFANLTGAIVEITYVPFKDLYSEVKYGIKKNKYDIVFYGSQWIADFVDDLAPVPDSMINSQQFQNTITIYKKLAKWEDKYYNVTIDGDRNYMQFRTDIYSDLNINKEYYDETGEELKIPETWKELIEVSKFFQNKVYNGKKINGISQITNQDDLLFSQFLQYATPYVKHPDYIGKCIYFDSDSEDMEPLINSPGFIEALNKFVEMQDINVSEEKKSLSDQINEFGKGNAVFCTSWDDPFVEAMQKKSEIRNKVVAEVLPGSRKVWNEEENRWDNFPDINYAPYIAWGWTSAVSRVSENKTIAFDYLGFFSNEVNHKSDLIIGRFGVNPYRVSDLDIEFWVNDAGWDLNVASSYVRTMNKISQHPNRVIDLRIHNSQLYMRSLAVGINRALEGRSTAEEALNVVYEEWKIITKNIGVEKQREAYKKSLEVFKTE
ncbi:hypothetical protein QUF55_00725 [Clostridiaceae bacterium HSG29]|nr:hypothetical protein [Clostridiaceae bacterium HSG29]